MEFVIDGAKMHTRQEAHDEIARALNFPEYYGRNLDALWDLLTTTKGKAVLTGVPGMLNALGGYGCRLLKTFYDAAEEHKGFDFCVQD